jgi:spore coat protein U-like protein
MKKKYLLALPLAIAPLLIDHSQRAWGKGYSCTLSTLAFSAYTLANINSSTNNITTTATLQCSSIGPAGTVIQFPAGNAGTMASAATNRILKDSSGNTINYNIYKDSNYTQVLGDGTSGTYAIYSGGGSLTVTIYGKVPGGQNPSVGTYSDTVTVNEYY